ncbi:STAS domain-containing protein [Streptomyces colonosanans]|uniref:Anti-anti-sigma factor n=1 Tax=Streptomyces colonosanans TaxID=1428652 RepID=A0A1S2PHF6_9ACTN|nr:STAS domain-containing protein [Streptomyces colonosanans]OIJ92825.1 anti-anti-sigma factor [Streptomyces colonosanans]
MAVTFRVTYGECGEWVVLRVAGELDLATSPVLRRRVHDAVADGRHRIVLDLSEVVLCDSSGVGVLIAARRLLRSCRGRLRLILPGPGDVAGTSPPGGTGGGGGAHVNRVLATLGVRRLFDVHPDLGSATGEDPSPLSA